jgi:hypothetical protein
MKVRAQYWALPLLVLWPVASLLIDPAAAAEKHLRDQIVGAWSLETFTAERGDGSRTEPFGTNPAGIVIFTPDGHFELFQSRSELPKIASDDRTKATAEEAMAIVGGSIAYYGTYSADEVDMSLSLDLEGATFANMLSGVTDKRIVTSISDGELKFENPTTPSGVTLQTAWKRTVPVK